MKHTNWKKRPLAALLALCLALTLCVPAMAEGEPMTASAAALALIEESEGFRAEKYLFNGKWYIGFGTQCEADEYPDGVTREEAELLLLGKIAAYEVKLNEFFTRYGVAPTQGQFDALISFSYNFGTGWMSGTSDLVKIARGEELAGFEGGEVNNMVPPQAECVVRVSAEEAKAALTASGFLAPEYEVSSDDAGAKIVAHGVASHAAAPEHGKSAILMLADALEKAGLVGGASLRAVQAIRFFAQGCYGEHMGIACEDPDTGKTTMTVGVARTYGDEIELHADCRLSVAANPAQMAARFEEAARNAGLDVIETKTTDPVFIEKTDPRVQALQKAYFEMTGDDCPPYTMGGGTYSRCMENAITFGLSLPQPVRPEGLPQGHGGAHAPDEFLYIPHWITGTMILLNAVLALDEIV